MPETIDVTGLPPEVIRSLQEQADAYRRRPPIPTPTPTAEAPAMSFWNGPVPTPGAPDWLNWFHAWCDSHPKREVVIDDDRESIYDRSCE